MMDVRGKIHCLVILVVVIILFSPVVENSVGLNSNSAYQQTSLDEFDVKITNLTFSDIEPNEGDNITISVTVRNNESSPIPDENIPIKNLTLSLMRFEQNITERKISIEGEANSTFEFEWEAEGGRHTITAFLSAETADSDEGIPLDERSADIWVEPEPIGDVYSPIIALFFVFVIIFGSAVIPSIWFSLTDRSSSRKKK